VSPEQQWKSFGTDGLDRRSDDRADRPRTQDPRWTPDPWDARPVPVGGRFTEEFPPAAEMHRPSVAPVRHVQPTAVPRSRLQQPADAGEAVRPTGRYRVVDQGRFWVGSVLTSGVAALAGVIGLVIAQDLLKVPVSLASIGMAGAHVGTYGMVAALVALLAALAYDGMLAFAPRPAIYYGWLTGLLVTLAVLLPFAAPVAVYSQLALALVNLVVGVSIMVLVPVAASSARTR
jgi:hypothetical protein